MAWVDQEWRWDLVAQRLWQILVAGAAGQGAGAAGQE